MWNRYRTVFPGIAALALAVCVMPVCGAWAQQVGLTPVIVEAESGELGSEFEVRTDDATGTTYVAITTDVAETTGSGSYPGENRTIRYQVTFPEAGSYELYARVRVSAGGFDDDSFFYGSAFGELDPADGAAWTMVNQLASAGYELADEYITEAGAAGNEVWKWVNLSENQLTGEAPVTFEVQEGALDQTLEIGARENGLDLDRFAFGPADVFFTVSNLDNGEEGVTEDPRGPGEEPTSTPLAEGLSKWLGNVYSGSQLPDFEQYWNQVTPENAGKWGSAEGSRDNMVWAPLDQAYALAKDNGWTFRFHVLIWGAQQPSWMQNLPEEEQLAELREWFELVAERYPDMDYVEVVNEPLHDPPSCAHPNNTDPQTGICRNDTGNYMEALGGEGETGWDWVITAFEMAREIFPPTTRLMINDYGILSSTSEAVRYRTIIELLQERDLIDAIGMQGHAFSTRSGNFSGQQVLDILARTGLPLMITEMDVDGNPNVANISQSESDDNQLETMQRVFPVLWEHESVVGITFWGWRAGMWRTDQEAYLVRSNGSERPALEWLRDYLASNASAREPESGVPSAFVLHQNFPNPFNPSTRIGFEVRRSAPVTLKVFDALGRNVATLLNEHPHAPGSYAVDFSAADLPSGVYLYTLQVDGAVDGRQMVLLK